jgi:hypothetical protein
MTQGAATVLLFDDEAVVGATEPAGSSGFALRDGSTELRRLFLHALARFGDGTVSFVARDAQRAFIGVSSTIGEHDLLFAPLLAGGRTLGVVAIALDGEPPSDEREALAAFCGVATRMLDSERALALARRQSRDSQLLSMVNERLHKSLDRRDVLFGIVEGVRAAFSADRCFVYERMSEGDHATVVAAAIKGAVGTTPKTAVALDADLRKVFGGLTVRRDEIEGAEIYGAGARSAVALPFVVDGRVEDALVLAFDRPRGFDEADIAALRSLAFHVGLALSNARLYERERARRAQAESLERVVRILRDTQYVDEVPFVFAKRADSNPWRRSIARCSSRFSRSTSPRTSRCSRVLRAMRSLTGDRASSSRCVSTARYGDASSFARLRVAWIGRPRSARPSFVRWVRISRSHLQTRTPTSVNCAGRKSAKRLLKLRARFSVTPRSARWPTSCAALQSRSCTRIEPACCGGTASVMRSSANTGVVSRRRSLRADSTSCIEPSV